MDKSKFKKEARNSTTIRNVLIQTSKNFATYYEI